MRRTTRTHIVLAFIGVLLGVVAVVAVPPLWNARQSAMTLDLFRKHVLDPIPPSVTEIRVTETRLPWGYAYRFKLAKDDLALILDSAPFERLSVAYEGGSVGFWRLSGIPMTGVTIGRSEWASAPEWLTPQLWHDPQVYGFVREEPKREITKTFIYNADEEEAYFFALISNELSWPGPYDRGKW